MAYKVIITGKFENSAAKVSKRLKQEWSLKSSLEFDKKLAAIIDQIIINSTIGRLSAKKNIRSFGVTKHNRIYYKITKTQVTFLTLFETKQNPKPNKYE